MTRTLERLRRCAGAALCLMLVANGGAVRPALGQVPAPGVLPSASPTPAATAAANTDPCGGATRLLATLNRPTVGYSACAVPAGAVLLEEGYQNSVQGTAPAQVTAAYPQGFERLGVAERFELDLFGPTYDRMRTDAMVNTGYNDLGLGFKYELPQHGRFTYGIDGIFTAATGGNAFTFGAPTQTANVDVAYALSPAVGLGTTLAIQANAGFDDRGDRVRYGAFMPSVVVTTQIPNAYQFYVEFVGLTKISPGAGGRVYTDFGVQKLLGRNTEIDVEYGAGFTPNAGSLHYIGFGTGVRL